jgi:hypothetical protein
VKIILSLSTMSSGDEDAFDASALAVLYQFRTNRRIYIHPHASQSRRLQQYKHKLIVSRYADPASANQVLLIVDTSS